MKSFPRFLWLAVLSLVAEGRLCAQTPPSLENDIRNIFSAQPATAWPPPSPALSTARTGNQFKSGTPLGGWQTARVTRRGVDLLNPGFEQPALADGSSAAAPAGSSWTMDSNAGLTTPTAGFAPAAVQGRQAAYIQSTGSVTQTVRLVAGTYSLRFSAVARKDWLANGLKLQLGSTLVAEWPSTAFSLTEWREFAVANATVTTPGLYTIAFSGVGGTGSRATVIDAIAMESVAQPNAAPFVAATSVGVTLGSAAALYGLASDGQYLYVKHGTAAIWVYKFDGTRVAANPVANLASDSNEMTWAKGYLYARNGGTLYRISTKDWSSQPVSVDSAAPLLSSGGYMTANLISTPDGRLGTVGPTSGGQFTVRFFSLSADGLSLTWSQDHILSETATFDEHGFATDGTHLFRLIFGASYKAYTLATGAVATTGTWNLITPSSGVSLVNPTYLTRDHVSGRFIIGDHNGSKVIMTAAAAAAPELLAGSSSTAAATTGITLKLPRGYPVDAGGSAIAGQGVQLESALLARPLVARSTSFALGAQIPPPAYSSTGAAIAAADAANFYLPQPQNAATGKFYFSPHAQQVFATQPGVVDIVWVERVSGLTNSRQYVISASPVKPVKNVYWTENGFTGPLIQVPSSRVATVNIVYNTLFPALVAANYERPGETAGSTTVTTTSGTTTTTGSSLDLTVAKRTLWFNPTDNALHAYNAEGRVFVEFLGALQSDGATRQFLGSEIIQVTKEVMPRTERVAIGDELLPINGETGLAPVVVTGTTDRDGQGAFLHQAAATASASGLRLFAVRATTPLYTGGAEIPSNEVLLYWMETGDLGLRWPKYYAGYIHAWPTDLAKYSMYMRSLDVATATAVPLNAADNPALVYQDDPTKAHAAVSADLKFSTTVTAAAPVGRSLIRYTNGPNIWFERVYSQLNTAAADYPTTTAANVGARLLPPTGTDSLVGYIRQASGTAFNPTAYRDPFVVGFDAAQQGAIIGVNALANQNILEVWWYKKNAPTGTGFGNTYWPAVVKRYALQWPTAPAGTIVLASNLGTGDLPSLQAKGSIYVQNTAGLPGYNPNEEHAVMLSGRAYALRDDLNLSTSSSKYVLLDYTEADGRPAMAVYAVVAEDALNNKVFRYTATAGTVLQAPMPLPLLPLPLRSATLPTGATDATYWSTYFGASAQWVFPASAAGKGVANHEIPLATSNDAPVKASLTATSANDSAPQYGGFTWLDRKGATWVYRGMHGVVGRATASFTMRYFYPTQTGFWFPELATQPAVGTVVPYGRKVASDHPVYGEPRTVDYVPGWPASAPQLLIGQTLTDAKNGLTAIRGQTSAEVIYQQSLALDSAGALTSVQLFDPTRAKTYPLSATTLAKIPSSIATDVYQGKTYFTRLPPHLSQRFYLDPTQGTLGALVLKGQFVEEALGDDYLLLNVLSADDVTALKGLVDAADSVTYAGKKAWEDAIDGLTTKLQTFKEDSSKKGTYIVDTGSAATATTAAKPDPTVNVGGTGVAAITNDDTAVDSYALNAAGGGSGYVVVSVGNGRAFTPVDEPVSLSVFKVAAPLYRGELKVVAPSNPLDEKITLRHSLDFAGNPADYEFQWLYAPPVDGAPPVLYTYTALGGLLGSGSSKLYNQPGTDFALLRLPEASPSTTPISAGATVNALPVAVTINDSADTVGVHGVSRPQAVVRKQFDVATLPLKAYLSVQLGNRDGAEIYLNESLVAVVNRDPARNTAVTATPTGFSPLPLLFEVSAALLRTTGNVLSLELYTDADLGVGSSVDARLEGLMETFTTSSWIPITAATTETASTLTTGSIVGKVQHVIQGSSLLTLSDNYLTVRYRARSATNAAYVAPSAATNPGGWSKWTEPALAEGWIKRALAGINPFQQRTTDLFSNAISIDVSLVQQAGKRWEGDIALNLANINNFGLIEIYETILRRGKMLSIDGAPAINYSPANDALLLAAGYLSDLYMIHGNEAYADAANPTIAYGIDSGAVYGDVSTSLFAFKGQLPGVIDEELALLRGRDNALQPGTQVTPVYNRLVWNYTRGIASGEAIYALNYNIKDTNGDGVVDAADAALAYPQGHGDAYGHYLTALTGYYGLLANPNFSWVPRTEAVTVLGKPVAVDYLDERKFATAAVGLARAAGQIIDLTYRQTYSSAAVTTWANLKDGAVSGGITRRWGVDDWGTRGCQGAYLHWLTGNSLLPAKDADPTHTGIQIIDRTTVPELAELVVQAAALQQSLNNADGHLNPLGLADGALAFDIAPASVDAGTTHFEQIYQRATHALENTIAAFNQAKNSTQLLRQQGDSLAAGREAITGQEQAYTNQLIELYGTPYADDIGPGKTYVQDYAGPDLLHYVYIDKPDAMGSTDAKTYVHYLSPALTFADNQGKATINGLESGSTAISYSVDSSGQYSKPADWVGQRASPGKLQTAASQVLLARLALVNAHENYSGLTDDLRSRVELFQATLTRNADLVANLNDYQTKFTALELILQATASAKWLLGDAVEIQKELTTAAGEALPSVTGFIAGVAAGVIADVTSAPRAAIQVAGAGANFLMRNGVTLLQLSESLTQQVKDSLGRLQEIEKEAIAWKAEYAQLVYDLKADLGNLLGAQSGLDVALRNYDQAVRDYRALLATGDRIQAERETFRKRGAALVQGYRTKDVAFRAFRDEALEKYKQLFDLASRYAYLAGTAYDFETGLLNAAGNSTAAAFLTKIAKARSPGVVVGGVPQVGGSTTGDPGLAGALAQLNADWSVAKARLGFNNPDNYRTTFSLRAENYRILSGTAGDPGWRAILQAAWRDNLLDDPDAARYCLNLGLSANLAVPGLILEFSTTISPGYNFFGQPLAGGDSVFSETSFATKIRASGVAFTGYSGMVGPNATTNVVTSIGGTSPQDPYTAYTSAAALSATPYVYLIPVGADSMRTPLGGSNVVRTWEVKDQAIPLPFNIGGNDVVGAVNWSSANTLGEAFTLRQHQAFRAVPDGTIFNSGTGFTNARLVGRSVWNSKWKLIIPGKTLLADPNQGLQVFIDTVKDIKVYLQSYSHAGN